MKKRNYIGVLSGICALVVLGGCYEPLEITDKELDMVAEYAAGVLVEHGTQTTEALLDRAEQKIAQQLSATPTPRPTKTPEKEEEKNPAVTQPADVTKKPEATTVPDNTELTMQD
ncbi:MAG: hypothetical protein ACI4QX_04460, partial [Lachnospiraceae bacterium]